MFVAVSSPLSNVGRHIVGQFGIEFLVALGLSLVLRTTRINTPLGAAAFLGLIGLIAGIDTHFPNWNWSGFPTSYLVVGIGYLAANWFIAGLALGALRRKLDGS